MTSRAFSVAAVSMAFCATPALAVPLIDTTGVPEAVVAEMFQTEEELKTGEVRTLAGKVLTAIALERVTGLKPDPMRFSELR